MTWFVCRDGFCAMWLKLLSYWLRLSGDGRLVAGNRSRRRCSSKCIQLHQRRSIWWFLGRPKLPARFLGSSTRLVLSEKLRRWFHSYERHLINICTAENHWVCLRKAVASKSDVVVLVAKDLSVLWAVQRSGKADSDDGSECDEEFHDDKDLLCLLSGKLQIVLMKLTRRLRLFIQGKAERVYTLRQSKHSVQQQASSLLLAQSHNWTTNKTIQLSLCAREAMQTKRMAEKKWEARWIQRGAMKLLENIVTWRVHTSKEREDEDDAIMYRFIIFLIVRN